MDMKKRLYHATNKDNVDSILSDGLRLNESTKISNDPRLNDELVYGFDNLDDAINFMVYDNSTDIDDVAVFTFDAENIIEDPEYDGNSFAVNLYTNLKLLKDII